MRLLNNDPKNPIIVESIFSLLYNFSVHIEQSYGLNPAEAINSVEALAESFMDPRYREGYTTEGITFGKSRDEARKLLPRRYRTPEVYQLAVGGTNYPTFAFLLDAATQIEGRGTFSNAYEPEKRFHFGDLVRHNLKEDETLPKVLRDFGVLGRDDLRWFLRIRYNDGELVCGVGDNSDLSGYDDKFQALYERFFGRFFNK